MMDFIISFFKTLNSASNKKMISLAVVLGLISGFLPTFTFINYLIFLIVLIFRIPIGLYLASFSLFGVVSYIFDPFFNKIGALILKAQVLNDFWTFLYNLPILRWSEFNNTIVMGSLVSGVVVGVVLFIVLNRLIEIYRENVFEKLKDIKYLKWLVPKEEKGFIRISGVIVGAVTIIAIYLLLPFIVKNAIELSLNRTFKVVKVKEVKVDFSPSIELNGLIIDKFLVKKAYIKLDWEYLLWKKFSAEMIIDAKTNENILTLIKIKKSINAPKIELPNINGEDILNNLDLQTPKAIEKLKKDYKKILQDIKNLNYKKYKNELKLLQKEIKSLSKVKVKNPNDLERLISKIKEIESKVKEIEKNIKKDKEIVLNSKKILLEDIKNVKIALKNDLEMIDNKFKMIKNGEYVNLLSPYIKPYIKEFIEKIKSKKFSAQKEIKRYGEIVKFKDNINYPDYLIKNAKATLTTSIAKWRVNVVNLADNQKLLNKEAKISAVAESKFYSGNVKIKYLSSYKYNGVIKNIKLKELNFDKLKILHPIIDVKFEGIDYNAKVKLYFNNAKLVVKNRFINDLVNDISRFALNVEVKNENVLITSDLDRLIGKKLQKIALKRVNKLKKRLQESVNKALVSVNIRGVDLKLNEINSVESLSKSLEKTALKLIEDKKKEIINKGINRIFDTLFK